MLMYPSVLLLIVISLPLEVFFSFWRLKKRESRILQLGDKPLTDTLIIGVSTTQRRVKYTLKLSAMVCLLIALARPVWGIAEEAVNAEGIAIIVVLDVSRSMDAQDVSPNRIERAKLTARTLFESNEGNLIGLVLFAGDAFVQFPLTSDVHSATTFLNAASTDSITRQGTALGIGIRLAQETLDERITARSVILLLTDGEGSLEDVSPESVAEQAAEAGIIIHAIGYGSAEGTTIPMMNEDGTVIGAVTDDEGNIVITKLDEDTLQTIAQTTGGIYRRASESGIEIVDILNAVNQLEIDVLESHLQIRLIERFALFVLFALILLGADVFIGERR
jgi:Ca-activated chloride channel family protein